MDAPIIIIAVCCLCTLCVMVITFLGVSVPWGSGKLENRQIGQGAVASKATVTAVVKFASTAKSSDELANKLIAMGARKADVKDFASAMNTLQDAPRIQALKNFLGLQTRTEHEVNFLLLTLDYLVDQPASVQNAVAVTCPDGYTPCSDPSFNPSGEQGAAEAFGKVGLPASQICCKRGNAIIDPRPDCQKKIREAQQAFEIALAVVTTLISIVPMIPELSIARVAAQTATAVDRGMTAMAQGALSTAGKIQMGVNKLSLVGLRSAEAAAGAFSFVAGDLLGQALGGLSYINTGQPFISCQKCKGDFFNGDPKGIVVKRYKTDTGAEEIGAWQSENGCPVAFGTPNSLEYYRKLGDAMNTFFKEFGDYQPQFPYAGKPGCKEGCAAIATMPQWIAAGKKDMSCYAECPNSPAGRETEALHAGGCNLYCDMTGRKTLFRG